MDLVQVGLMKTCEIEMTSKKKKEIRKSELVIGRVCVIGVKKTSSTQTNFLL